MALEVFKFVNCIIYGLVIVFLLYSIGNKKEFKNFTPKRWIGIIILSFVFIITANYLVPITFKLLVIILMLFVLCCFIYNISFTKKILKVFVVITISSFTDIILSSIFIYVFKCDMMEMMSNIYFFSLYNIVNILLTISISMMFRMKMGKYIFRENISKLAQALVLTITVLQIIRVILEFFIFYYIGTLSHLQYISLISYMCSIFSIILLLYTINVIINKENIIKMSNEYNEKLNVYNEVLQNSIENQRKISHEHGNQLTVLSGYISNCDLEKANQYLSKIVGKENIDNEQLQYVKESGLKALLVFKIAMMEKKNIEFETVIDEDFDDTIIPSEDMCNIMGVFLDNAIDAASLSEEPFITLSIIKNESDLIISVMNSIKDTSIDTAKIFKKGFSSKGEGRGFGLYLVDEIVNKYEELDLQTKVEEGLFIQELHVKAKSTSSTKS